MNASSVTPKTAGIESSAKSRSMLPMAISTMNSGVTMRLPSTLVDELALDVLVGDRQQPPGRAHDAVALDVGVLVAVPEQLHRRVDQQQAEQQEHEREQRQQRGAERDEDPPHDQGEDDAERQHLVLVALGHRERRHDDHEDEQVVDREALLDDPAREVLGARVTAVGGGEPDAERDGDADVEHRPRHRFLEADLVRAHRGEYEVDREQPEHQRDRHPPGESADLQHAHALPVSALPTLDQRSRGPPGSRGSP